MAAAILILTWLGRKGDVFFNLKQPWLTIVGAISGIAAGMYWLFNSLPRSDKK
ncbi:MAG: AtpZ/AtpI family protein [Bacteroidetes bacterium]|nr:AtpZ/AtpI family protein [Bacteroidota bacterium]